ncbi:recombinase family protein [Vibrio mediterranei]|uniref:recombinase family protein n=1 Tax=Vibrio mediterranei TaxID=689 RepID=UPI00148C00D8|nr:recombinase family protein [Vibrio mediterranei]NOI26501.1 recombinase family protein [Vibrio mediterranei]
MALVGYARVSSIEQDLSTQLEALKAANCKKIYSEKKSGSKSEGRDQLEACLDYMREGDTLVVTRIDRLSRSLYDLQHLVKKLKEEGIHLKATSQPIDTSNASGKAFFDMLGVFAEFETSLRYERQLEGIARAKKAGKYKGRQPTARNQSHKVVELIHEGYTRQSVATQLNIGIASVYRILKDYRDNHPSTQLPGTRSKRKIATLEIWLRIENNSKFVRGKKKTREDIEHDWSFYYDMTKTPSDDYRLQVPYESKQELEDTVYDIMSEAQSTADLRHCHIECFVKHLETGKQWD